MRGYLTDVIISISPSSAEDALAVRKSCRENNIAMWVLDAAQVNYEFLSSDAVIFSAISRTSESEEVEPLEKDAARFIDLVHGSPLARSVSPLAAFAKHVAVKEEPLDDEPITIVKFPECSAEGNQKQAGDAPSSSEVQSSLKIASNACRISRSQVPSTRNSSAPSSPTSTPHVPSAPSKSTSTPSIPSASSQATSATSSPISAPYVPVTPSNPTSTPRFPSALSSPSSAPRVPSAPSNPTFTLRVPFAHSEPVNQPSADSARSTRKRLCRESRPPPKVNKSKRQDHEPALGSQEANTSAKVGRIVIDLEADDVPTPCNKPAKKAKANSQRPQQLCPLYAAWSARRAAVYAPHVPVPQVRRS